MADIKWIKITTDIFDDEKILLIESMPSADSIITIWFKLLVLAGKQNNSGVFTMNDRIPYTDEMLATIFRRDINTVRLALSTFRKFEMIEIVDGVITIPNWNKHQTLDSYEKKKERDRLYQQKRRDEQRRIAEKSSDTSADYSSDIAVSDKEEDKEIEEDKERDNNIPPLSPLEGETEVKKAKRFIPPTVEEVDEYLKSVGSQVDAEAFVAYYESIGWLVGNHKMKSWKHAIVTWEKKKGLKRIRPTKLPKEEPEEEIYTGDDW